MSLVVDGRRLAVPADEKGFSFDTQAAKHALNIDRRTCKREVPMKVLVFGLSRTGTTSIRHALLQLGYFDVYHGVSPWNENPPDAKLWLEAFKGKYQEGRKFEKEDWDCLLGHCMAVTGTPCSLFAQELIEAYPSAKVILTVRDDSEVWRRSMESTLVPMTRRVQLLSSLGRLLSLFWPQDVLQEYGNQTAKYTRVLDVPWDHERMYDDYSAWIRRLVPEKGGLLVYNAKEGWEPLCRFLEVETPDTEFPRNNDGGGYMERFGCFQDNTKKQRRKAFEGGVFAVLVIVTITSMVGYGLL